MKNIRIIALISATVGVGMYLLGRDWSKKEDYVTAPVRTATDTLLKEATDLVEED